MANNLEILYNSLKRDNYDVPATYESFARTLTASGMEGVRNRQALYNSLRNDDYDVPDTYESFATTLFVPAMSRQNGNGISGAQAQRTGSGGKSTSRGDLVQTASTSQRDADPTVATSPRDAVQTASTSQRDADPTVATSPRDAVQTASTSQRDAAPVGNVAPAGHVMTPSERLRVATHELEAAQSAVARKEEERKARQAEKDYYKAVQEEEEQIRERNAEGRARADAEGIDWNAVPNEGETEVRYDDLLSEQAQVKRLANTAGYLGPHLDKEGAQTMSSDIGEGVYYHRDGRTSQEREPFAARARAMNDPEDIYRTPTGSGIDPRGASADPIALPELEVTGSSRGSIMKRVDEMRFLDESLKDVSEVELRKRASMELQSERDEVDARLEKWKEENPGKWRDMSREDRAELKAGFADDVNFERFMSGIDARIAANEREQQRRMSEIERQVREDLSKTPEGRRLLKEPDSDMDIRRRVELAAGYDSEIRALRQESWNLGEMRNAKLAAESDGGRESLWNFAKGVGRGLRDIVENPLGLKSMHNDATQLMRVFGKLQEGEALTDTEQRAVESHFTRQMDDTHYDMSQSAKAGEFTAALAEIAIEFGLNPASGAVRRVLTGIAREVGPAAVRATVMNAPALLYKLGVSSTEIGARAFAGNIAKVIGAAIGEGAGATFSTQLAKNLEESVSRAISMPVYDASGNLAGLAGDSFGNAAAKTFTTSAGTNAVFMLPAHFGGEAMKGLGRFAEYVDQRGMGIPFGNPVDALVKMKSGEIIGVIASDVYGRSLGDPTMGDVFSEEAAKEMIIGLLAAEFTTGGMKFAGRQIKGSTLDMAIIKNEAEVRRAAAKMAASLKNQDGAVDAEGLRILEMVMGADASMDPGVIGNCLKTLAESGAPQETRQAALDYLRASYRWRGSVARREQWRESGKEQDWRDEPDVSTSRRDAAPTEESPSRRDAAPGKEAAPDGGRPRNERALVSPEEIEREKARQRADEALRGGYEAVDPEIRAEMQRNAESAVAGIYDRFEHPEDVMEILDGIEDAEGLIKEVHENEYMDALQKEAAEAYVLSSMAERGMSMRREDDRVKAREDIREDVGRMSTPDGMLRPVTLKRYDRQVMVLSGEIVLSDDGSTVLPSESSSVLWIYDPATGGPRAAAPEEILSVGPVMTAEAEIERRIKELEAIEAQAESQEVMSGSQSQATGSEVEADVDAVAMRMQQAYQAVEDAFGSEAEYYMFHVHENPEAVLSDPEIPDFQKDAVREYLEAMKALEEEDGKETTSKAETPSVPGMPENGPNSTENIVSEGEIAPEAVSNVENGQQTALSRIPTNEQGEPKFEAVDKDTAWDGLVEAVGGEADAADIAMAQVRQASTELEALKKKPPTLKAPKLQGSPMAMAQAKRKANEQYQRELSQYDQQIAEAQTRLDAWNGIVGVYKSRNAELRRQQEEKRRTEVESGAVGESDTGAGARMGGETSGNLSKKEVVSSEENDENGRPFVLADDGTTSFGHIDEESGLTAAPIKLSEGFQDEVTGQGYGLIYIEVGHGEQIRAAGFKSVKDFVSFVAKNYDRDNIRVGKRRPNGSGTFLIQVTDRHDNTLFIELSKDGSYWNVNSGGIFRKGYSNKKETVAKTEPQQPDNAVSGGSSLSKGSQTGISPSEPNGKPTVSTGKVNTLSTDKQADSAESSGESPSRRDAVPNYESTPRREAAPDVLPSRKRSNTGVDKEIRAAAEEMRDCPEALEILSNMDPQDIYEAASVVLATNRVLLSDAQGAIGAKREMGLGRIEQKKYFGLFASAEKGGKSIQKLSEDAMQELCGQYGIPYDNMDARNALLEILQSHSTRGEIGNYIRNRRLEQARKIYRDWENMLEDEEERAAWEAYGMTLADLEAYNEMRDGDAMEHLQDLDEREYNATFVDTYTQREEEYDRRAKESVGSGDDHGIREIAGYESSGERPLSGRGDEVLSGEKSYKASGIEADERSGVQSGDGTEGAVETDGVSAGASGIANKITEAERLVNTEPTEAQKKAGNYRMGHVWVDGHNITIENPKGSVRRGVDVEGKPWETRMNNTYGYICGTQSVDGDHIDVFLSDAPERGDVFVVDQVDKDGNFDEHKVMYGFPSVEAAREAYLSNYKPGWTGLGAITHVSKDEFKKWIGSSKRKTKPFADYKSIRDITHNVDQTPTNVNEDGVIVDADGKPLTLYHGTPNDVELSDLSIGHTREGDNEAARYNGDGISFTPNRDVAEDYASSNGGKGKVFEVNVTLKKPYYTLGVANFTPEEAAEFTASLQAKGHDGIINYQSKAMRKAGAVPNEVIVFDVKSTTSATAKCPVCGKAGIANYHTHDVVCPQCNSDLSVFRQIAELREEEKQDLSDKFKGEDNQGNPIDHVGNLIVEDVKSIDDITDEDFVNPARTVGLPKLPGIVSDAIGSKGKRVIIKKNIFGKNHKNHRELTPAESREILRTALYTPSLYGQNQKHKRPFNWILIHLADKNTCVLLEVDNTKENCEIINWHYLREETQKQKERQAEREGGRILTLSEGNAVGNTSQGLSSDGKDNALSADKQADSVKSSGESPSRRDAAPKGNTMPDVQLEDFGEKIAGARKDLLKDIAKSIETVTVQSLIELPLAKAFKRPNLKKMVESGTISNEDAALAEAVMLGLVYAKKKPAISRSPRRKREIKEWSRETYDGIRLLGEVLSGDPARRDRAMELRDQKLAERLAEENRHIDKLREWNPGKEFPYLTALPDEVDVLRRVLEGINHQAGDKINLPLTRINLGPTRKTYVTESSGKQGSFWFKHSHDSLEEAVETMIFAAKLARGDEDVEIPARHFVTRGIGQPHSEPTGKHVVVYWAKDGKTLNEKVFKDKTEAETFAAENNGRVRKQVRYLNEYDNYVAVVVNPLTGTKHEIGKEYPDRSTLAVWMDESHDELNRLAVEAIQNEMGNKKSKQNHFYVTSTRINGKVVHSVVANDKRNPWPILKDFATRKKAEDWLESNRAELEDSRQKRIDTERSVVYFNTGEQREGKDWRKGNPATPEMYDEQFGFRGVQFGNWTNNNDRQAAMNQAYDALMDLSEQLGLSPRAMSLHGELGLAFGARGGGNAGAHYEPVEVVINLTKTKGSGSLAHEWWHALDNYLSRKAGVALGLATSGHGRENMDPTVAAAIDALMQAVRTSDYGQRGMMKGDYWGRPTELVARLFESWVSERIKSRKELSPFLASGLNENALRLYQQLNYLYYRADEHRKADSEQRAPQVMSKEEFFKTTASLNGYPYPTKEEIAEFSPYIEDLFVRLKNKEASDGMMAQEPRRGYGRRRSVNTGINLFDWADKEDRKNNRTERDEEIAAAEEADSAIDTYADVYDEYLRESQRFENELATQGHDEELRKEIEESIGYQESRVIETRDWLEDNLKQFYVRNNTPEDAKRLAHDMVVRVQAEVEYRRNTGWMLKEILGNKEDVTPPPIEEMRESPVPDIVKTAGGERIETEGHGGLRRLGEGEFSLVERKFSTTGEFSFTTDGRIESMDDVAYIFRSLENYSVEHTFALLVKEGKPLIVHLGMGGPTASMADLTAIRAAYDAHGADSAWFVHNHPSGVMRPSPQDISLLKEVEKIFPAGVMQDGLIIDVTSGRYCTFDSSAGEVGKGEARHPEGAERPVEVKQFDRSAFKEGFDPEKLSQVTSSEAAARYISTERLGERAKTGVLLLNNQNKVVGNLYSRETDLKTYEARKRLVEEIAQLGTKYGARNVIIYGNSGIGALDKVMNLSEKISGISGGIRLLDVIQITNGLDSGTDVAYRSANDGTLRAAEPEVKSHREDSAMTGGEDRRYRDGHELSDGERLRAIRDLEPIEVERNDMSRAELREVYNNLPSVEKDGREIEFYRSAFKKIYKDGGLFGQVVPVLDEILEQSVLAYSEEDNLGGMTRPDGTIHKEHPNTLSFDNYVGKVDIDGIGHYVRITIQHDKGNRNGMHSCFVTEVEIYENAGLQATGTENSRVKPYNSGIVDAKLQQFFERASAEADKLDMRDRAVELSEKLNTPIRIVTDEAELSELSEDGKPRYSRRERRAKGWWDGQTGEIVIVLPNNRDIADVDNTVVHEVVGHKGLRALVGEERFDEFLGEIYDHASNSIRKVIDKMTDDMVNAEADRLRVRKAQAHERTGEDVNANYYTDMAEARVEADAKRGGFRKEATEEYMADLGGRIGSEGFEKMSRDELTLWGKIKAKVQSFLDKFLRGLKIAKSIQLTDKDLAYILYKSWRNMRDGKSSLRSDHNTGGIFAEAEDVAMRMRTGWDDAMLSESAKMEDANNHFNRQLKRYMSGDMGKNEMLHLGMPLGVMSQFLPRLPIVMRQRVIRKGSEKKHEVDVGSIMNMPQHLSSPIFVFQRSKDTIGVLTDMQDRNGKNVCVAIELKRQIQNGGECLEINDVRSFHGREFKNIVEPIVNNNTLKWVDKEKGLAYLSSASQPVQQEIDKQVLDYAAKVIKTFENPTFYSDEEVRFRDGADYVERVPVMARAMYEKQIQSSMYQFTEAMQDSMRGLMEFYKAVESQGAKRNIEDVASFENAYIAENLMSSKSHAEMEEYEHRILRPLLDVAARMSVNKRGRDKLIDYMMAKHGLERNAYMRNEAIANGEESERDFAGLCGLTGEQDWQDAETAALQIVDDYEAAHSADIAEFWGAVNKATKTSLKKIYDCGMLSKDQYEKIRDMYDYYIPLRGFDEKTSDDVYGYLTGKGGAFSSPIKRAEGRKSKADDPLATIAYMAQNSILQGNRNVMKQRFLTYVHNHPSDLASVNRLWLVHDETADTWKPVFADVDENMTPDEIDKAVMNFEQRMEALSQSEPDKYKRGRDAIGIPYRIVDGNIKEHQVLVKRNGESFVITINGNPRAAQAINGLTNPDNDLNGAIGKVFNVAGTVNRWLSQVYTTLNPDFVVSNFIRDLIYSNTMVHVKENQSYAMKFHKNHAKVNPVRMVRLLRLYDENRLDMHNPVHRMFYEFMHWGGETGYTMQRNLEQEKKLVSKILKEARRGKLHPMSILNLVGNGLDQINRGVENSARFAAFITSRESGRNIQRSVYDAKEVSVNFNKKGAGSKFMDSKGQTIVGKTAGFTSGLGRSFYVFWNAAVQGTTNYAKAFKKHPEKAMMTTTALVLLGYVMAALLDDGDDESKNGYYNVPKYTRRSNLMFHSGNQWITIPLPVEYRALYGLGELAYGVTSGREEYSDSELAKETASQLSQILPLDFMEGDGGLHAFVPSAFKPLVESATNTSWTGLPIYKDTPFNKDMPAWTKSYPRTNSQLVDLSKWANEASGGNDYKAGWANFNPAQLEYLLNGYFGGYSNVINKMIKTGETMLRKREYDPSSILLVNRLVKMGDERTAEKKINSDFFHYLEEYKRTHALLRKYEDEADRGTDKYRILLNALRHSIDGVRHDVMEEYMADYNWLNKAIKDPDTTDKERAMYEDEMRALKREIVLLMKTAHDSVQINRLKNFSPHNTYSNNNMNVNHIDNI